MGMVQPKVGFPRAKPLFRTRLLTWSVDSSRSTSYMQVIRMLDAIGPAKLHDEEQAEVRSVADTLVLAPEFDHEVGDALNRIGALRDRLVESGRFSPELGNELVLRVRACAPLPVSSGSAA